MNKKNLFDMLARDHLSEYVPVGVINSRKRLRAYYRDAFDAVVKRGIPFWNGNAALLGGFWFLYYKMYLRAAVYLSVDAVYVFLMHLGKNTNGDNGTLISVLSTIIFILYKLAAICFFGFYGNRMLFNDIQCKENAGYFLIPKYKIKDYPGELLLILGFYILYQSLSFNNFIYARIFMFYTFTIIYSLVSHFYWKKKTKKIVL